MSKFFNALAVAVLGIALLMGAASAADMAITGTLGASTEVTVSNPSVAWTLYVGSNTHTGESATINSNIIDASNDATLSVAEVASNSGNNVADGYMAIDASPYTALASPLGLDAADPGTDKIPITGIAAVIYKLEAAGSQTINFDLKQAIGTDAPGTYKATLAFTGAVVAD